MTTYFYEEASVLTTARHRLETLSIRYLKRKTSNLKTVLLLYSEKKFEQPFLVFVSNAYNSLNGKFG
jgi:hypothetical protein